MATESDSDTSEVDFGVEQPELIIHNIEIDCSDTEDDELINNIKRCKFGPTPIVYTTKLDDMEIFKQDLDDMDMTIEYLADFIQIESRPTFTTITKKKPRQPGGITYNKLVQILNKFNYKCKKSTDPSITIQDHILKENNDVGSRKQTLESLCIPVSVVLENSLSNFVTDEQKKNANIQNYQIDQNFLYSGSGVEAINYFLCNKSHQSLIRQCYLVITIESYNEMNIYQIDNQGYVIYHNQISSIDLTALAPYQVVTPQRINVFKSCCWYVRQEMIKAMHVVLNCKFMRRSHKCDQFSCNCCCKKIYKKTGTGANVKKNSNITSSGAKDIKTINEASQPTHDPLASADDLEIQSLENEISHTIIKLQHDIVNHTLSDNDWHRELMIEDSNSRSVINEALRYNRKPPPKSKTFSTTNVLEPKKYKPIVLRVRYKGATTISALYETNIRGQLLFFEYRTFDKKDNITNVCCWVSYKNFVLMAKSFSHLHSIRFIKVNHNCAVGHCKCCCRNKCLRRLRYNLQLTLGIDSMPEAVRKIPYAPTKSIPTIILETADNTTEIKIDSHVTNPVPVCLHVPQTNTQLIPNRSMVPDSVSMNNVVSTETTEVYQSNNVFVSDTDIKPNPVYEQSPLLTTQLMAPLAMPTKSKVVFLNSLHAYPSIPNNNIVGSTNDPALISSTPQQLGVQTMINSILHRFQDVRLTINQDGKVAAALSTPMDTLTTAELKVLSAILSHAEKQVAELGLGPGANLSNHINIAKAINTVSSETDVDKMLPMSNSSPIHSRNTYEPFTKYTSKKLKCYNKAFDSYIGHVREKSGHNVPVIQNVFSLQNVENNQLASNVSKILDTCNVTNKTCTMYNEGEIKTYKRKKPVKNVSQSGKKVKRISVTNKKASTKSRPLTPQNVCESSSICKDVITVDGNAPEGTNIIQVMQTAPGNILWMPELTPIRNSNIQMLQHIPILSIQQQQGQSLSTDVEMVETTSNNTLTNHNQLQPQQFEVNDSNKDIRLLSQSTQAIDPILCISECLDSDMGLNTGNKTCQDLINRTIQVQLTSESNLPRSPMDSILQNILEQSKLADTNHLDEPKQEAVNDEENNVNMINITRFNDDDDQCILGV